MSIYVDKAKHQTQRKDINLNHVNKFKHCVTKRNRCLLMLGNGRKYCDRSFRPVLAQVTERARMRERSCSEVKGASPYGGCRGVEAPGWGPTRHVEPC